MVARYHAMMNEQVRPDKFRAYRARKRAAGLHEVRLWLPDPQSPAFAGLLARERDAAERARRRGSTADETAWDRAGVAEMASWTDWSA